MKDYRFKVEIPSSRHSSRESRKIGGCSSRSQDSERLIIIFNSFPSQSGDFNSFSQGNLEDKQKLQLWEGQSIPLNSPNLCNKNLSKLTQIASVKIVSQIYQENNKSK